MPRGPAPLDRLLARFLAEVQRLGDRAIATGDYRRWADDFQRALVDYHLGAYFLGKDATDLSPAAERVLRTLIEQQLQFARVFGSERSELSDRAFLARSSLYAGALKATYSHAKWADWDLPFHPTEGCECIVNCQCHWDGQQLDRPVASFYWVLGENEHCPTCLQRWQDGKPYKIRRKNVTETNDRARGAARAAA